MPIANHQSKVIHKDEQPHPYRCQISRIEERGEVSGAEANVMVDHGPYRRCSYCYQRTSGVIRSAR